jgi:hypothetical protein
LSKTIDHFYKIITVSVNETATDEISAADCHIKDSEVHVTSENDNNADDEVSSDEVRVISSADSHMQSTGEYQSSVNDNNTDEVSSDEVRVISSLDNHMQNTKILVPIFNIKFRFRFSIVYVYKSNISTIF